MTDAEKKMNRYTNAVERRLNLPKEVKFRVMSDFISSIAARRETGQTDEQILSELGSPKKVASELNEQMREFACGKNPWRFAFLALALWGMAELLPGMLGYAWLLWLELKGSLFASTSFEVIGGVVSSGADHSVGLIGGADGPTAIFVTTPGWVHAMIPAALILVGILGYLKLKKK